MAHYHHLEMILGGGGAERATEHRTKIINYLTQVKGEFEDKKNKLEELLGSMQSKSFSFEAGPSAPPAYE